MIYYRCRKGGHVMKYHVYIQGYSEDDTANDTVNDYDKPVAVFEDKEQAIWFATHYPRHTQKL